MSSITLLDRIKTIFSLATSQSFFISLFIIILFTVVVLIVDIKVKSKASKYAVGIAYFGVAILILSRYGKYLSNLGDSVVDKFFRGMYFPNVVVYFAMLIISILLLIYVLVDGKFSLFSKISTFSCFSLLWFFFVMLLDTAKGDNVSFYKVEEVYANETIAILMQASMAIFVIWFVIFLADLVVRWMASRMDEKDKSLNNKTKEKPIKEKKNFGKVLKKIKRKKDDDEVTDYVPNEPSSGSNNDDDFTPQL